MELMPTIGSIERIATISGGVLYAIAALLLVALTVIVERTWALTWAARAGAKLTERLRATPRIDTRDVESLRKRYAQVPHAALLAVLLEHPDLRGREQLLGLLDEALMLQVPRVDRGLWLLDTIVTLGPLLGLLGTIIGIFSAFQVLGNPGTVPAQVTSGVAEALIATAAGLLLAIIGLIFFNGLQKRVRVVVQQMETIKLILVNRLAVHACNPVYETPARDGRDVTLREAN